MYARWVPAAIPANPRVIGSIVYRRLADPLTDRPRSSRSTAIVALGGGEFGPTDFVPAKAGTITTGRRDATQSTNSPLFVTITDKAMGPVCEGTTIDAGTTIMS